MPFLLPRCAAVAVTALTITLLAPAAAQATGVDAAQATGVDAAKTEVAKLVEDVEAASAEYEAVEGRLEAQRDRVEAAEARVASQARLITAMEAEFRELAVESFKRGGVDPQLSVLVGGGDYAAASSTLTVLSERRSLTLTDVKDAKAELDRVRALAAQELDEVVVLEADLAERRAAIEARLAGAQDLLAQAEAAYQARLAAEAERARVEASRSARTEAAEAAETDAAGPAEPAVAASSGDLQLPVEGRVTSPFGNRIHPITGAGKLHSGTDIANSCGTPVVAAESGFVESAKWNGSYGNIVVLTHPDAGLSTAYAHLESFAVTSGPVARGEVIGYVGTTGMSTGCHLHFEVRTGGEQVDPMSYL